MRSKLTLTANGPAFACAAWTSSIVWSAEQPGFQFQSDTPPDPAANLISVLGREENGVFFS